MDVFGAEKNSTSLCGEDDYHCADWANCLDTLFPCSHTVIGNLVLMLFYGIILSRGAKLIADGSELLAEILDPGFVGGCLLPVLGAVPDAAVVIVSCLGNPDEIQDQIKVGVGTIAGSTIMLLTVAWVGSLIVGRSVIENGKAVDFRPSEKRWDFKNSGISVFADVVTNTNWMMITLLPYFIIQIAAFFFRGDTRAPAEEKYYALAGFIISALLFLIYCVYQVRSANSKEQQKRYIDEMKKKHTQATVVSAFIHSFTLRNSMIDREESQGLLTSAGRSESVARGIGLRWKLKSKMASMEEQAVEAAEDSVEAEQKEEQTVTSRQIAMKALLLLTIGTVLVVGFSDPMVDAITACGKYAHISPFYLSFIVTPLASNASELIASLQFAAKKRKLNSSMSFSAVYGAVTMNNTLVVSIFLILVYSRGLAWTFSAETIAIVTVVMIVGLFSHRVTFRLWYIFPVGVLYPLSIALVAFLESPLVGLSDK
eukprot:GCRY01004324.1.p1 GENE.GCRY01004324.1~~GCRY01004324.1.p1  ORF type:complete len:484 (+),score=131.65 GCRY01004324.1:156-1607(+)